MYVTLLLMLGLLAFTPAACGYSVTPSETELVSLAVDKGWLALMHYRPNKIRAGWTSEADAPAFFLARNGKHSPRDELIENIRVLLGDGHDSSARCLFPARYVWLSKRLGLPLEAGFPAHCPTLQTWLDDLPADRLSIDFASSYLENPSSMFGHTFLRFSRGNQPALLSPTVNYAADSSKQDSKLGFIVKGLMGGFPGLADQLPDYRRLREYSDNEGRDLWEYPLYLDREQIDLLRLHLWEIRDGTFDYYFLDENCSYRTLGLIAVARPDLDLLDSFNLDVVPIETIKVLRDKDLVGTGQFVPSSIRTVQWHTRNFTTDETRRVIEIAEARRRPNDLKDGPTNDRAELLAAAGEYLAIRINRNQLAVDTRARLTRALIDARLQYAPPPNDPPPTPAGPDRGHGGHLLSATVTDRDGASGIELGIAGFQHTLNDPLAGYAKGAAVTILGLKYRLEDGHGYLQRFDIVAVESKTPSTALFQQAAWALQFGLDRKAIADRRSLIGTLGYSTGRAIETDVGILSLTAGASVDGGDALDDRAAVEGALKLSLIRQTSRFSYHLYYEDARYLVGEDSVRHRYGIEIGVPLMHEFSITAALERGGALVTENEASIGLRHFF